MNRESHVCPVWCISKRWSSSTDANRCSSWECVLCPLAQTTYWGANSCILRCILCRKLDADLFHGHFTGPQATESIFNKPVFLKEAKTIPFIMKSSLNKGHIFKEKLRFSCNSEHRWVTKNCLWQENHNFGNTNLKKARVSHSLCMRTTLNIQKYCSHTKPKDKIHGTQWSQFNSICLKNEKSMTSEIKCHPHSTVIWYNSTSVLNK